MSHFYIIMTSLSQDFIIWEAYGLTIISKLVYVRTYVHSVWGRQYFPGLPKFQQKAGYF